LKLHVLIVLAELRSVRLQPVRAWAHKAWFLIVSLGFFALGKFIVLTEISSIRLQPVCVRDNKAGLLIVSLGRCALWKVWDGKARLSSVSRGLCALGKLIVLAELLSIRLLLIVLPELRSVWLQPVCA
jgi:hypothetical protein